MKQERENHTPVNPSAATRVDELELLVADLRAKVDELEADSQRRYDDWQDKENRRVAVEGAWHTVVNAIREVAEQRGWVHDNDDRLGAVVVQLGYESGNWYRHYDLFRSVDSPHTEYPDDPLDWDMVEWTLDNTVTLIRLLREDLKRGPVPFTIKSQQDQQRIAYLLKVDLPRHDAAAQNVLDCVLPLESSSDVGFSPAYGYHLPDITSYCAGS